MTKKYIVTLTDEERAHLGMPDEARHSLGPTIAPGPPVAPGRYGPVR